MGDWDLYCAFCGACFYNSNDLLPEGEHVPPKLSPRSGVPVDKTSEEGEDSDVDLTVDDGESFLDPAVTSEGNLGWLSRLRLIGENLKATSLKR